MSNPNRVDKPEVEKSEQTLLNQSFDREFNVLAVENLVYNQSSNTLDRQEQPLTGAELTAATQNVELINALRSLLQAVSIPSWYDPSTNSLRVGTTAVTVSSGTVTAVTTVGTLTNFGTNPADVMARDISISTWAMNSRSTIT